MRLDSIEISNMRLVGQKPLKIDFAQNKNITLIVGDNGAGKTTILDAIAFMLSPFISQFPRQALLTPQDEDIHLDEKGKLTSFLQIFATLSKSEINLQDSENKTISEYRARKGMEKAPESNIKDLRDYASSIASRIKEGDANVKLPVLAYYGTDRGNIVGPERRRYTSTTYERWDCYSDSLISSTNFKRFFAWFDLMEDEERRVRDERWDKTYQSPVLRTVRGALHQLLGATYNNPRILTKPLRFVMDEKSNHGTRELRIEQMSAGYKMMIAMVADLAARMSEANPDSNNPLTESGIVLIDEIDLHLHARWQRLVLSQLGAIFKNVQFIVTTHSPLVVLGANDSNVQLIRLKESGACDLSQSDMSSYDVSMILLSEAFSLSSVYSQSIEKMYERRKVLLLKDKVTEEELQELNDLNKKVMLLPNIGESEQQKKLNAFLFDWADKNGML